jgi:transcriptional regulator with XRE-family HTH domain
MNLKVYLTTQDMSIKDFSELVGISTRYMSRIIHGQASPSKHIRQTIFELCDGKVNLDQHLTSKKRSPKVLG